MNNKYEYIEIPASAKNDIIRLLNVRGDSRASLEKLFSEKNYDRINQMIQYQMNVKSGDSSSRGYEAKKIFDRALMDGFSDFFGLSVGDLSEESLKKARNDMFQELHPDNNSGVVKDDRLYSIDPYFSHLGKLMENNSDYIAEERAKNSIDINMNSSDNPDVNVNNVVDSSSNEVDNSRDTGAVNMNSVSSDIDVEIVDLEKQIEDKKAEIYDYQGDLSDRGIDYTSQAMDQHYNDLVNELRSLEEQITRKKLSVEVADLTNKLKSVDEKILNYQEEQEAKGIDYSFWYADVYYRELIDEKTDLEKKLKDKGRVVPKNDSVSMNSSNNLDVNVNNVVVSNPVSRSNDSTVRSSNDNVSSNSNNRGAIDNNSSNRSSVGSNSGVNDNIVNNNTDLNFKNNEINEINKMIDDVELNLTKMDDELNNGNGDKFHNPKYLAALNELGELRKRLDVLKKNSNFYENTLIPKPRDRYYNESDKDYEKYLSEHFKKYEHLFKKVGIEGPVAGEVLGLPGPVLDNGKKPVSDGVLGIPMKPEPLGIEGPVAGDDGAHIIPEVPGLPGPVAGEVPVNKPKEPEKEIPERDSAPKRHAVDIMSSLCLDGARKADYRHLKYSNIKPVKSFVNNIKNEDNYIYNIAGFYRNVISIPAGFVQKLYGRIGYGSESRERIAKIQEKVDALTDEELDTINKEFVGGQIVDYKYPRVVTEAVARKMNEYKLKKLKEYNLQLEVVATDLINRQIKIDEINEKLSAASLSNEERIKLEQEKSNYLNGSANKVKEFVRMREDANRLVSYNFTEDAKATLSKMNYMGKFFSESTEVITDEQKELRKKLGELDNIIYDSNDDEESLSAFVNNEVLMEKNSKFERSIFGKRDVGQVSNKNRFQVNELDRRRDPLVGDILRSTALITSVVAAASSINSAVSNENTRVEFNQKVTDANAKNESFTSSVHSEAENIAAYSDEFLQGSDKISYLIATVKGEIQHNTAQRLDGYKGGALDVQAHEDYAEMMSNVQNSVDSIQKNLQSGAIDTVTALKQYAETSDDLFKQLSDYCANNLSNLQNYANSSNWDYTPYLEAMQYFSSSDNLSGMFDGMQQALTSAELLSNMEAVILPTLDGLSNDVKEVLMSLAAVHAFGIYTSYAMNDAMKKGEYGGKAKESLDELIAKRKEREEKNKGPKEENRDDEKKVGATKKNRKKPIWFFDDEDMFDEYGTEDEYDDENKNEEEEGRRRGGRR